MKNKANLSFGNGNAKLDKSIATFSLPAGHSCPFAKDCLSKADRKTGKIVDGKHCQFRCFAASDEMLYPNVRISRWNNFEKLKQADSVEAMTDLIQKSLLQKMGYVRIHPSGDFFSEKYFVAWLNIAKNNPLMTFYGYTKATPFLVKYKKHIPDNFRFTASRGGTCDNLIGKHRLKAAEVVFSENEAVEKGLEIDHDDSLAMFGKRSFALLLHGRQPGGSIASKAVSMLKQNGIKGYQRKGQGRVGVHAEKTVKIFLTIKNGKLIENQNTGM